MEVSRTQPGLGEKQKLSAEARYILLGSLKKRKNLGEKRPWWTGGRSPVSAVTVPHPRAPLAYLSQSYICLSIAHIDLSNPTVHAGTRARIHAPRSLKDAITKDGIPVSHEAGAGARARWLHAPLVQTEHVRGSKTTR